MSSSVEWYMALIAPRPGIQHYLVAVPCSISRTGYIPNQRAFVQVHAICHGRCRLQSQKSIIQCHGPLLNMHALDQKIEHAPVEMNSEQEDCLIYRTVS